MPLDHWEVPLEPKNLAYTQNKDPYKYQESMFCMLSVHTYRYTFRHHSVIEP